MSAPVSVDSVKTKIEELQKDIESYEYEREQARQKHDDEVELTKLKLEVAREVAASAGEAAGNTAAEAGKSAVKWLFGNLVK